MAKLINAPAIAAATRALFSSKAMFVLSVAPSLIWAMCESRKESARARQPAGVLLPATLH